MFYGNDGLDQLERQETLKKLEEHGLGKFVELLLSNENKVYTKKGRLNKSGACRILNCKPKELEEMLLRSRDILKNIY